MSNVLYLKRIFSGKLYWLSVMAAILLLLCSIVYIDDLTGKQYTFISLFYDKNVVEALQYGEISLYGLLLGYDTGYLWMFCPILAGIPCVLTEKTERFVLFRTSKNLYFLGKYFSDLFASGCILFFSYLVYMLLSMALLKEMIWDMNLVLKLLSVFCWGMVSAVPGMVLSEFMENKYLILCIPFVLNYFVYIFLMNLIPYKAWEYLSPYHFQILFLNDTKYICSGVILLLVLILACAFVKKLSFERRCDCGQK